MNEQVSDQVLMDYLSGSLEKAEADKVEIALREDEGVRNRYFELQHSFEIAICHGSHEHRMSHEELARVRSQVLASLASQVNATKGNEEMPRRRKQRTWDWSGWRMAAGTLAAAAAVWLLTFSVGVFRSGPAGPEEALAGPSLVVYEITEDGMIDLESIESGANIRELVFIQDKAYDGLARAEGYAEQLWSEYLDKRQHEPEALRGRGFVVLDLHGKQGFAGFYEHAEPASRPHESLWFAGGQSRDVPVGLIDPEPGVFYFKLDKDRMKLATLNEFVPVARSRAANEM